MTEHLHDKPMARLAGSLGVTEEACWGALDKSGERRGWLPPYVKNIVFGWNPPEEAE